VAKNDEISLPYMFYFEYWYNIEDFLPWNALKDFQP
jgi:hypothetical protein